MTGCLEPEGEAEGTRRRHVSCCGHSLSQRPGIASSGSALILASTRQFESRCKDEDWEHTALPVLLGCGVLPAPLAEACRACSTSFQLKYLLACHGSSSEGTSHLSERLLKPLLEQQGTGAKGILRVCSDQVACSRWGASEPVLQCLLYRALADEPLRFSSCKFGEPVADMLRRASVLFTVKHTRGISDLEPAQRGSAVMTDRNQREQDSVSS